MGLLETALESNDELRKRIAELEALLEQKDKIPVCQTMSAPQKKKDFGEIVRLPAAVTKNLMRMIVSGNTEEANKILEAHGISMFEEEENESPMEHRKNMIYQRAEAYEKAGDYRNAMNLRYDAFINALPYWSYDEDEVEQFWKSEKERMGWNYTIL